MIMGEILTGDEGNIITACNTYKPVRIIMEIYILGIFPVGFRRLFSRSMWG